MIPSITITILTVLAGIWKYLKLTTRIFKLIGTITLFVSRLPGDLIWSYIGNLPEDQQQKVFKVTIYVTAGLISLGIIVFGFKWLFGY